MQIISQAFYCVSNIRIEKKQIDAANTRCKRGNSITETPAAYQNRELAQCGKIKHEEMNIMLANNKSSFLLNIKGKNAQK